MSTIRFFSGGRDWSKRGIASDAMRFEIMKKGKLPATERYKRIMTKKLEENKKKALGNKVKPFSTPFNLAEVRKMSKRTEQVLQEIAARKANKLAKAEQQMVIVQPRVFPNGTLNKKGQIYDVAGNLVAKVNTKNGKIVTNTGWDIGKYKPRSYFNGILIQDTINKYSPYFIQQRRLALMQQQGVEVINVHGTTLPDVINVQGRMVDTNQDGSLSAGNQGFSGSTGLGMGPRQNIGMTSWGARSDNVWGTYADNTWGQSMDNVWGGNATDVWGGIGIGGMWGQKGMHVWGTGNGMNYLKGLTARIAAFFGFKTKSVSNNLKTLRSFSTFRAARTTSATVRSAPSGRR